MQDKEQNSEETEVYADYYMPNNAIDDSPIYSNNSLLYLHRNYDTYITTILTIPSLNTSAIKLTEKSSDLYLIKEFFFYSKSLNEEIVVHILSTQTSDIKYYMDFYRTNGDYICRKVVDIPDKKYNNYYGWNTPADLDQDPIKISPNGKFIYYITRQK
jgi:hypothetical protein